MRIDSLPNLLPFNRGERPGVSGGSLDKTLNGLDLSGIVYRPAKSFGDRPATSSPVMDLPGLSPIHAGQPLGEDARLEQQARQLVSQTFFGTMLKQMRDSPFKSDLFEGGRGGQAFSSLYDQKLVEQMSRGAGKKLVDSIVRKFTEARKAYARQAKTTPQSTTAGEQHFDAINAGPTLPVPADASTRDATNPYRNVKINVHPAL